MVPFYILFNGPIVLSNILGILLSKERCKMSKERVVGRLELRGGDIFLNNQPKSKNEILELFKQALNHNIVFQNGGHLRFCVEKSFGQIVATFPASAPCSLDYLWTIINRRLGTDGPVSTLHQDEFYKDQPLK